METIYNTIYRCKKLVSPRTGVIKHVISINRGNNDPKIVSYGVSVGNTTYLGGEFFEGRSSGCAFTQTDAFLSTIGETVERYSPTYYNLNDFVFNSYNNLQELAIHPDEFALYHERQFEYYKSQNYKIKKFQEDTEIYWARCLDLTNKKEVLCPCTYIYLPWSSDKNPIMFGASTGLAAHTNYYKAVLTALFEVIERDSFVITWHNKITNRKIKISPEISKYIKSVFPNNYEWHFFDITYDLGIPSVFSICLGKAEYGNFIIVSTATRYTIGEAIKKVILETAQSVPYYRYLHSKRKDWIPDLDFNKLMNFEDHSLFYNRRPEYLYVFDDWRNAPERINVDFDGNSQQTAVKEQINSILLKLKSKEYNVLIKDLTTPDVNQAGFFCVRIVVPQLLPMSGAYPFYHLGGKRLYEVPQTIGLKKKSFEELNKFPHPFP